MIHVIASVRLKPGQQAAYLHVLRSHLPLVWQEQGCLEYTPAVDIDAALPGQDMDGAVVTIIEKWESMDALQAHLQTPHMLAYRSEVQEMVEEVSLKVLQTADQVPDPPVE
ncbi:putative quinol monooxygenase [Desulfohalobium retbaense]|uniref:Antibiotic biosynthesis monooxygenase n=1 Tax=Desulfohalobium retbaense (strain ATCC 49708 / DSM 5692 / JCM 16813 / HR100) TaxID=485915 RepID=C8X1T0_DESRD|nr:putative quinol monooxygenase [Desulfohalobium retbaense]ACV68502.1 Antibiotic biosynthesis monooxygenase [Desulfohalobium retbaense DSM 5692]